MFKKNYIWLFLLLVVTPPLFADDLNDGIAHDEAINDDLELKRNLNFIQRNAMAKALRGSKNTIVQCGQGNQTFGPGTDLKGATIVNLSNNKNTTSICNEKNQ